MKVIDCFTFFNELDLLEFRLRLLENRVDKFIICESNYTHSGKPKPHYLEQNMSRFDRWKDKIIYLPIEQSIEGLSFNKVNSYTPTDGAWILENQQRLALSYGNDYIDDNDLVLIGDLDEIPNPKVITKLIQSGIIVEGVNEAVSFPQLFHYYYMNCQVLGYDRIWHGTVATAGNNFKTHGPQRFRDHRNHFTKIPEEGGWHFSYLGGVDKIKTKIESFAHTEFNRPDITSEENISKAVKEGSDIFKRNGVSYEYVSVDSYPEHLRSLMLQYPQFIRDVPKGDS